MSLLLKTNRNGFFNPFNSLTSDLFGDDFFEGEIFNRPSLPAVNVKETDTYFNLELAAPGFEKGDFAISYENGVLSISAESKKETEEEDKDYTRKEFSYSKFSRSFTLPESVNNDDIEAEYNNGVLNLKLNKKEEAQVETAKKIQVK